MLVSWDNTKAGLPGHYKHFFDSKLSHQVPAERPLKVEYSVCEIEIPTSTRRSPAYQSQNSHRIRTEDPDFLTCLYRITAKTLHRLLLLESGLSGVDFLAHLA